MSVFEKYVAAGARKTWMHYLMCSMKIICIWHQITWKQRKASQKSWVENTFANYDLKLIHEDKDTMIITFIEEDFRKSTKDFVTEVLLLKDGQIFRSASKTEPID